MDCQGLHGPVVAKLLSPVFTVTTHPVDNINYYNEYRHKQEDEIPIHILILTILC